MFVLPSGFYLRVGGISSSGQDMVHNSQVFLPAYQKDITAGLFFPAFFIYFFFFCKYINMVEPNSCWQVQGAPFHSLSPKSLFPVLGAEQAVPAAPAPEGPWHRDVGQSLVPIPALLHLLWDQELLVLTRGEVEAAHPSSFFPPPLCSCRELRSAQLPLAGAGTN